MKPRVAAICLAVLCSHLGGAEPEAAHKVMTAAGDGFDGKLVSLSKTEAVVQTRSGRRAVAVGELWSIRFADSGNLMWEPGQKVVALAGGRGEWLAAGRLGVEDGKVTVRSSLLGQVTLDMSAVGAIYLPGPGQSARLCRQRYREMKLPPVGQDYLVASDGKGNWIPVAGVLKSISAEKVVFEFEGRDRAVEIDSVRVVALARMAGKQVVPAGYLVGRDGSTVGFGSVSMTGSSLSAEGVAGGAKSVDLSALAEIRFRSDRCVHLSDLAPAKVVEEGLFDISFGHRRDQSTAGGPIRLGGTDYSRGLGLHSRCELSYDLQAEYVRLAATVGIDDAAPLGNAELKILGDGKELIEPLKLAAKAKPVTVSCDLSGVKVLTVIVDFGDDGVDVGDHVCLAEARLVKPQATTAPAD